MHPFYISNYIENKIKNIDPDILLESIYNRVKENQELWNPKTQIFSTQTFFIIVLVNSIKKLKRVSLKEANNEQLIEFLSEIVLNNITNQEHLSFLIKCSKKSKNYHCWNDYHQEFCNDWHDLLFYLIEKIDNHPQKHVESDVLSLLYKHMSI